MREGGNGGHVKVEVLLLQVDASTWRAEIPGLSIADREGPSAEEALEATLDVAAMYLEPREPGFLSFDVRLADGSEYRGPTGPG